MEKKFPEGMEPLGTEPITFACHSKVDCFTICCRKVDMFLFPYDVICLKNRLKMDSRNFMHRHTTLVQADNPYFPAVMLKLDDPEKCCPFLHDEGCTVYTNRPSSCRTYPLERAVDRRPERGRNEDFYFLKKHDYCLGHNEEQKVTVKQWLRNQQVEYYNQMNDLWTEMDTLFATNPWRGEGVGGEKQRLAFMVCYDIDGYRKLIEDNQIIKQFQLPKEQRRRMARDDVELMKFGFEWLKLVLTGKSSLIRK